MKITDLLTKPGPAIARALVLQFAVEASYQVPGNIVEFGVYNGDSTRVIAKTLRRMQRTQIGGPRKQVFACDSFEGLPEKFENADVGTFACDPPKIRGVNIVKGYFEASLTPELAQRVGRVAFASLDADLFSSTLCALNWLTPLLGAGSLLLFDEYLGGEQAEKRAHEQWQQESGVEVEQIARFARDPAGWGSTPDERVLFRVVGDSGPPPAVNLREIGQALVTEARRVSRRRGRVSAPTNT